MITMFDSFDPNLRRAASARLEAVLKQAFIGSFNAERQGKVRFVQIGGNDGKMKDPLNAWIRFNPWQGCIYEPVRMYFDKLTATYSGKEGVTLVNKAVSAEAGTLDIYFVKESAASTYPAWAAGLASVDINHLVKHGIDKEHCDVASVECVKASQILEANGLEKIDILCIDVEGHELPILRSFSELDSGVGLIVFEVKHMKEEEKAALNALADKMGMNLYLLRQDGLMIRRDDPVRNAIISAMVESAKA